MRFNHDGFVFDKDGEALVVEVKGGRSEQNHKRSLCPSLSTGGLGRNCIADAQWKIMGLQSTHTDSGHVPGLEDDLSLCFPVG